jgi:hypothetical protein
MEREECGGYCHCCGLNSLDEYIAIAGIRDADGIYYGSLCDPCWHMIRKENGTYSIQDTDALLALDSIGLGAS